MMRFQRQVRMTTFMLCEFLLGPRSPFVGAGGGGMLLIGLAFEASRFLKIAARQFARAS